MISEAFVTFAFRRFIFPIFHCIQPISNIRVVNCSLDAILVWPPFPVDCARFIRSGLIRSLCTKLGITGITGIFQFANARRQDLRDNPLNVSRKLVCSFQSGALCVYVDIVLLSLCVSRIIFNICLPHSI